MSLSHLRWLAPVVLATAAGCAADVESTRVPGRPAEEVRAALVAPSPYRGAATTLRIGLGEAPAWELLCPGRLSLLREDDPAERVLVGEGRVVHASLARAEPGVAGACPSVEVAGDPSRIPLDRPLQFFRELGFDPRVEVAGSRFALTRDGQQGALDRRRTRIVLEPCAPRPEAEESCRWIREDYRKACTVVDGIVKSPRGRVALETSRGVEIGEWPDPVVARCEGADTVYLRERDETDWRSYRGSLLLTSAGPETLLVVNEIGLEDYVRGVVPKEIYPSAPAAALEAQAIAARSVAVAGLGRRHRDQPYDLCDRSHCQAYGGLDPATPETDRAVSATEGLVLVLGGEPFEPVYHAVCGGRTEDNEMPWPAQAPQPALRGVPDRFVPDLPEGAQIPLPDLSDPTALAEYLFHPPAAFCAKVGEPGRFRWSRSFGVDELARLVDPEGSLGRIVALEPEERGFSARITSLVVRGTLAARRIEGELAIRRALGDLPSSAFLVETLPRSTPEEPVEPAVFVLVGAGHGHGAGMCQRGAVGMAREGYDRDAILSHYYAGARPLPLLP